MMGGWMSALDGWMSSLSGAGGFINTLGKIGKGLGRAVDYYNNISSGGQQNSVNDWPDVSPVQNALQDEVKRQLEAMKQERILKDLMRYEPLEGQGGTSGRTINPYRQ